MKIIYVILIGLVVFNGVIVFTNSIGVFPGPTYEGQEIDTINGQKIDNMSGEDLVNIALGGLNPVAVGSSIAIFGAAILAAIAFKSPAPLAIGGFASIFTGIWIQTYVTIMQFPVSSILLGIGTVVMGILFIINCIAMAYGGQEG